jgi:release factor glutamine methyltransferase
MDTQFSVADALARARHSFQPFSDSALLDAQVLLSQVTHKPRAWLLAHGENKLAPWEIEAFVEAVDRYCGGEALPYILGWWEFYGRRFALTPEVLIPRPETELLVEIGLKRLATMGANPQVLDVGTGSGCIAITLALECPHARVFATDLSAPALRLARANAKNYGVADRVQFLQADLLGPFLGKIDLLCANLPYIRSGDLPHLAVGGREPRLALDGGADGMAHLRRLIRSAEERLESQATALLEIGADQGAQLMHWIRRGCAPERVRLHPDLAGLDRLVELSY